VFDGDGLCLFQKRLERGRFIWPQATSGTVSLTRAQLSLLLEGIDWRQPQRTWEPQSAGINGSVLHYDCDITMAYSLPWLMRMPAVDHNGAQKPRERHSLHEFYLPKRMGNRSDTRSSSIPLARLSGKKYKQVLWGRQVSTFRGGKMVFQVRARRRHVPLTSNQALIDCYGDLL
jgi:hypothetical protein